MMASSPSSTLSLTLGHTHTLSLPNSLSLSFSNSFSLLGINTDQQQSRQLKLHHRTHTVGDEAEDIEVVTASFVRHETPPLAVKEACDGREGGGARTPVTGHF